MPDLLTRLPQHPRPPACAGPAPAPVDLARGGWIRADARGWTCCVEQGRYGHYATKPTLLYAVGTDLPELRWGKSPPPTEADFPPDAVAKHGLAYCKRAGVLAFKGGGTDSAPRIGTPPEFRDLLLSIARSVRQ